MFIIKSTHFEVYINPLGAELQQFTHITHGNLLWQKNDKLWNRFAPILFPVVGRLLNDQYTLNNESYGMRQHGFARDQVFQVIDHSEDSMVNFPVLVNFPVFVALPFFKQRINIII